MFVITFSSCNQETEKQKIKEDYKETIVKTSRKVSGIKLTKGEFSYEIITNGIIHNGLKAELAFEHTGIIEKLFVKNGSDVHQGDTIAIMNNREEYLNLKKARIRILEAQNELSSLILGFGGSIGDTSHVDKTILNSLKIQSGYAQALLNEKIAEISYRNTFLLSPISGVVANLNVQQYHRVNTEKLCSILSKDNYLVEFSIIEQEVSKISENQNVKVYPLAYGKIAFNGKIKEINPVIDDNGLVSVSAVVEKNNSDYPLFEGMNARVVIEEKIYNSLVIPKSALVLRNNKEVVFTYKSGKAYWNYVKTSAENSTSYLISEGLQEGDTVIINGNVNLAHDAAVYLNN